MAISIKKVTLWSAEIANRPSTLGRTLEPLADAGINLGVVMAYDKPDDRSRSVVEVAPITGAKAQRAAKAGGLTSSSIPCLLVEGDNRAGIGHAMTAGLGAAGINIHFTMALVVGKKFRTVFGFGQEANLDAATRAIRSSVVAAKKPAAKKPPARKKAATGRKKPR
jgi:hypothetical protein